MAEQKKHKPSRQMVGNAGLYYVCYELSKRCWNVLPTSKNARGVDAVIYSRDATRTHTIQVKALSGRADVPIGSNLDNLIAEYLMICRRVLAEKPECFIAKIDQVKDRIGIDYNKKGGESCWLPIKDYEGFKDN